MSGDIEQEYFADGVADDIITELACVRSLFVIARNSSFAYKGRAVDEGRSPGNWAFAMSWRAVFGAAAAARHGPTRGRGDWKSPVGQPI